MRKRFLPGLFQELPAGKADTLAEDTEYIQDPRDNKYTHKSNQSFVQKPNVIL